MSPIARPALAIALCFVGHLAAISQDHPSLKIAPVRWQLLPEAIKSVVVGPDGRTWCQLNGDSQGRSDAALRDLLASEYRQTSPQISGAALALLEPSGRAWFYVKDGREIWAFDGQKWIERQAAPGSTFVGYCPTNGQPPDNLVNCVAGGKTWLRDQQGLHIFDGQNWSYTALCVPLNTLTDIPRFAVSRQGKFAAAFVPKTPQRGASALVDPDLWVCENGDGRWIKRLIAWPKTSVVVGRMVVTDDGMLYCLRGGSLRAYSLIAARDARTWSPQLIRELDDDDFQIRQRAYDKLLEIGEHLLPELAAALDASKSPEQSQRLKAILLEVNRDKSGLDIRPGAVGTYIGPCHYRAVKQLHQDANGKLYIFADYIVRGNHDAVSGLAIVQPDKETTIHQLTALMPPLTLDESGSYLLVTPQTGALWIAPSLQVGDGPPTSPIPPTRIKLSVPAPDVRFSTVRAIDAQGRMFLAGSSRDPLARSASRLGLLTPTIPDPRPTLAVHTEEIGRPDFVLASDGALWATRFRYGLSRYDGQDWQIIKHPLPPRFPANVPSNGPCYPMLAGRANVVLCKHDQSADFVLFHDNRFVAAAPLKKLVAAYKPIFAQGFPPGIHPLPQPFPRQLFNRTWIASDSASNIWIAELGRVSVYCNDNWLDEKALREAGASGSPQVLAPVGDGSKIYFGYPSAAADRRSAFLAFVAQGALQVERVAAPSSHPRVPAPLRDATGALWLAAFADNQPTQGIFPNASIRLTENAAAVETVSGVWPLLVDQSGHIWFTELRNGQPTNRLIVRSRTSQSIRGLEIPGVDSLYGLISDGPGSVYAWTTLGLQHLVSDSAETPVVYRLGESYALPPIPVSGDAHLYSEKLGLIIPAFAGRTKLSIIHLPAH